MAKTATVTTENESTKTEQTIVENVVNETLNAASEILDKTLDDLETKVEEPVIIEETKVEEPKIENSVINSSPDTITLTNKELVDKITEILETKNYYNYLQCGRHLKPGHLTNDSLKAFYNEFKFYGISDSLDSYLINFINKLSSETK
jgi:hypothetical protein